MASKKVVIRAASSVRRVGSGIRVQTSVDYSHYKQDHLSAGDRADYL